MQGGAGSDTAGQPPGSSIAGMSDAAIARSLSADDAGALRAVYERYGTVLFSYLRGVINDVGRAEDVFQQVMTEVWQRRHQYDEQRAGLLTWMMTIARSRAVDQLRRIQRTSPEVTLDGLSVFASGHDDELLERWRIADLLEKLPADERTVLRMRFYASLTQVEIAQRTATPLGTVKSQMVRGLERLRALLDAENEERRLDAPVVERTTTSRERR